LDPEGDAATISILDDSTATVSVAMTSAGDEDGPVSVVFTLTQSAISNEDTVISYSLSGTASAGTDFTAASGTVTIAAGETTATITLEVIDDNLVEGSEEVTITLDTISSGSPAVSLDSANSTASTPIADNDAGQVTIAVDADAT